MTPTPVTRPTGRGLGRRVADIVTATKLREGDTHPGPIIAGPEVVPFEAVPIAMLIADPAGEALGTNLKWAELSGISPMASLGTGWLAAVTDDSRSKLRADVRRVATSGTSLTVDYQRRSLPGRWTRWWIEPYDRAGERLVGIATAEIAEPQRRLPRRPARSGHAATRPASVPVALHPLLAQLPDLFTRLDSALVTIDQMASSGRI